jgi:hypothetical protein
VMGVGGDLSNRTGSECDLPEPVDSSPDSADEAKNSARLGFLRPIARRPCAFLP